MRLITGQILTYQVQAVCNAVWTTDVKNALKAKLIEIHGT